MRHGNGSPLIFPLFLLQKPRATTPSPPLVRGRSDIEIGSNQEIDVFIDVESMPNRPLRRGGRGGFGRGPGVLCLINPSKHQGVYPFRTQRNPGFPYEKRPNPKHLGMGFRGAACSTFCLQFVAVSCSQKGLKKDKSLNRTRAAANHLSCWRGRRERPSKKSGGGTEQAKNVKRRQEKRPQEHDTTRVTVCFNRRHQGGGG